MKKKQQLCYQLNQLMKFTGIQILIAFLAFGMVQAKETSAQKILQQEVTLSLEDVSLKTAMISIENMVKVSFVYSEQKVTTNGSISINAENKPLSSVLKELFTPFNISYEVYNNRTIVLTQTADKSTVLPPISGIVTDALGNALIGATVQVKGAGKGAITDVDGSFKLDVNPDDILVVSYTGYIIPIHI